MKTKTEGPVEGIARLEQRPHALSRALEKRLPGMHRGIVDDDVVVVEVEHAAKGRQVSQRRDSSNCRRYSESWPHRGASKARSSRPTAFHQRLGAFRSTASTRTPSRSASATRQVPAPSV